MVCWKKTILSAARPCRCAPEEPERGDVHAEVLPSARAARGGCCPGGQEDPPWGQSPVGWPWGRNPCLRPSHPPLYPAQSSRSEGKFALPKYLCKMLGVRVPQGTDLPCRWLCQDGSSCHGGISVGGAGGPPPGGMNGRGCPGSRGQPGWGSVSLPLFFPVIRQSNKSSGGRWLGRCCLLVNRLLLFVRSPAVPQGRLCNRGGELAQRTVGLIAPQMETPRPHPAPRSAGEPRAGLTQSDGKVPVDVPVLRSGFTPSRQSSFGSLLSRWQCPGLAPRPRAGHSARPRSPRRLELG